MTRGSLEVSSPTPRPAPSIGDQAAPQLAPGQGRMTKLYRTDTGKDTQTTRPFRKMEGGRCVPFMSGGVAGQEAWR